MDNATNPELQIDSPLSLLPDLSIYGIEEVDKGVCKDTSENRLIIRRDMKSHFQPIYDQSGKMTDLIQVITPEMRAAALSNNKKVILKDDRDVDSDYLTGIMLIVEPAADHIVPAWVLSATRHWLEVAEKRKTNPNFRPALTGPPTRCAAKKIDGHRCANWTNGTENYGDFCRTHLANRPGGEEEGSGYLAKARNRLQSAASAAVDELESLMTGAVSEPVRLNAARDILDRAGIRGGFEVDEHVLIVKPAADEVRDRIELLQAGIKLKKEIEARMNGEAEPDDELEAEEVIEDAVLVEEETDD